MTFLLVFAGGWLLIVVAVGVVYWRTRPGGPDVVSPAWLEQHRYKRHGDIPPGTSRQEERR